MNPGLAFRVTMGDRRLMGHILSWQSLSRVSRWEHFKILVPCLNFVNIAETQQAIWWSSIAEYWSDIITQNRGSTKSRLSNKTYLILNARKWVTLLTLQQKEFIHQSVTHHKIVKNLTNIVCPTLVKLLFLKKSKLQIVLKAEEWGLKGYWCCYWQCLLTHWWRRN